MCGGTLKKMESFWPKKLRELKFDLGFRVIGKYVSQIDSILRVNLNELWKSSQFEYYSPITRNLGSNFSSASVSTFWVKMIHFFFQCRTTFLCKQILLARMEVINSKYKADFTEFFDVILKLQLVNLIVPCKKSLHSAHCCMLALECIQFKSNSVAIVADKALPFTIKFHRVLK